ncbi:Rieske (2Fe-2S) protein [Mycobacterium deserti]|uniref:Rieske 2Fe-2S domain-containing protein n=1 Tax=Mycobacterium deserti TaxID=2978347 RepID=A0ABT2MB81_9MYCO|nr:Rieske 2Fe-2S domain-containing protein [Mycobacterium deserti]MCT7659517.1 Rieske 2Fe-2S domain-containing protein [Mycobacterium deserti]
MSWTRDPHGRSAPTRGILPPVTHDRPVEARGRRLVRVDELGERGVVEVKTDDYGVLAVGMTPAGAAFATGNICRHQFAKLGRGRVTESGCLECPWHRARYDVTDGTMREGPKGRVFGFKPYSSAVEALGRRLKLTTYPVEIRDGVIYLSEAD